MRSAQNHCTPEEVWRALAQVLVSGDMKALAPLTFRFSDFVQPASGDEQAGRDFDSATLRQNSDQVAAVRQHYGGNLRLRDVKPGRLQRNAHVEGTEFFIDRIDDSELLFEKDGREVVVVVSVMMKSRTGCWRLEGFGSGNRPQPGLEHPQPFPHADAPAGTGFSPFQPQHRCTTPVRSFRSCLVSSSNSTTSRFGSASGQCAKRK